MRAHLPIALSILALSLGACSNGGGGGAAPVTPVVGNTGNPAPTPVDIQGEFTYEYKFNGCTTGKQKLTSKNAYCDALLNDALNNNCAREMRVETYNRMCTSTQVTNPGVLPAMSTARCVVNGMDLKDRTFLQNMNPFNPQRRQIYRDMFWSAKSEQSYDILGSLIDTYGRGRFIMTPVQGDLAAQGEIHLNQQNGDNKFSVRSGLGSQIRLKVANYEIEKEVEAVCLSDKSFKRAKADLRRVKCSFNHTETGRKKTQRDEEIVWDVANTVEKEIFRGRSTERIILRLKPARAGKDELIEIEAVDLNVDKTLRAETTLNEGLGLRFRGQLSGIDLSLSCAPASK